MEDVVYNKLFGRKKLMVIQNQILEVAENVCAERKKEVGGSKYHKTSVTSVLNEAMKKGLEQMTGTDLPIPEWKSNVYGVTVLPLYMKKQVEQKGIISPDEISSDDL